MLYRWFHAAAFAAIFTSQPTADNIVIDDFEWCRQGFAIAPTAQSTPWCRFGEATMNEVIPTSDTAIKIEGNYSARYDLKWPGAFAKARRHFDDPVDLRLFEEVSFSVSSGEERTETTVTLDLNDGRSTCVSSKSIVLTEQVQVARFSLSEDDLQVIDGPATVDEVLRNCKSIGLHFQSSGRAYTETVVFDNLSLNRIRTDPVKDASVAKAKTGK